MEKPVVFLITFLSSLLAVIAAEADTESDLLSTCPPDRPVSAIFAFGDSTVDAGTNSLFDCTEQANWPPYGDAYFGKPTGRFTNGRTVVDFLARKLRLPFPEPYLKRAYRFNMLEGVNYASGGCGTLPETNRRRKLVPFNVQFEQFERTVEAITEALQSPEKARDHISRSIVVISVGLWDMIDFLRGPLSGRASVRLDKMLVQVMEEIREDVEMVFSAGARKFVFLGLEPIGCIPLVMEMADPKNETCVQLANDVTKAYNDFLEHLVLTRLPQFYEGIQAIMATPYELMLRLIEENDEGFTSKTSACCGTGKTMCGVTPEMISNKPFHLCRDADKYVFWDYLHTTERVNKLLAEKVWEGGKEFVFPMNLRQLAAL